MLPLDATAQQQVVAQAGACGVDSSQIATEVDEVGGDIYVTIKGRTLADAQISCLLTTERQ
jgi:hypothetical protein